MLEMQKILFGTVFAIHVGNAAIGKKQQIENRNCGRAKYNSQPKVM
jgi:hypothetical protein